MKALKIKETPAPPAYEVEKTLRVFSELTSEGLSTLLSALIVEVEEALDSSDLITKEQVLQLSLKSLDQALFISRNLRYFARKSHLSDRVTDISQHVLTVLDDLEKDFKEHGIELGAFVESGIYSRLDPGALEQILSNLLLNAISSMPKGGKLTVALGKSGTELEFCVSDTGRGLREEQLEHLFEPHHAIHQHAFHSKDRGLGLMVAKALIESEGGELIVRSTFGKGTNFIFKLPYDSQVGKPEPITQKRRTHRIQLTLPVEVSLSGQTPFMSRVTTLGSGGCFIELPHSLPGPAKNTSLSLTLFSIGDRPLPIESARVAYTISVGTGTGMGVEFLDLDAKTLKILTSTVKSHK